MIATKGKQGVCEVCDVTTEVFHTKGGILMCVGCISTEAESLKNVAQEHEMTSLVEHSRTVDTGMELKAELFNAKTIAAIELKAAIMADVTIADADKEYAYAKACDERRAHFQKLVFDKNQEKIELENTARMWQAQTQAAAADVRDARREQFKNLNSNYAPKPPKVIKPKETAPRNNTARMQEEIREASKKHGVEAATIQMLMLNRKLFKNADEAAASIARGMAIASQKSV